MIPSKQPYTMTLILLKTLHCDIRKVTSTMDILETMDFISSVKLTVKFDRNVA